MVFWLRQIEPINARGWLRPRVLICGGAIALHAISGARIDWLYLTHYGCTTNFSLANFICH
jgi:hypothetical protein